MNKSHGPERTEPKQKVLFIVQSVRVNLVYIGFFSIKADSPDPCQDFDYLTLDDDTRKMDHKISYDFGFCDQFGLTYTSPDWYGANWYKMVNPAESKVKTI